MLRLRMLCKPNTFQMKPHVPAKRWLRATGLTVCLVGLFLFAAACTAPPKPVDESGSASTFTSPPGGAPIVASDQREGYRPFTLDQLHAQVTLPPGWVGTDSPSWSAPELAPLAAFNSWGGSGFWAQLVREGAGFTYGGQSTLGQLPEGGAYVVVMGDPFRAMSSSYVEHEARDLADLWQSRDCRAGDRMAGIDGVGLCKWTHCYSIEVYCAPGVSDATAQAVTSLLESWQFDAFPAGDENWALQQASRALPETVTSLFSPVWAMSTRWTTPGETVETLFSEIVAEGDAFTVVFQYRWDDPPDQTNSRECPEDHCHWWRVEVAPDGAATLLEEGGAPLPQREG